MIVGCYLLHLYCDTPGCPNAQAWSRTDHAVFTAETGGECRMAARKLGWRLNLDDDTAACPTCARKK